MELLIFSDSHGDTEGMRQAIMRQVRRPDAICFLGDGLSDAEHLESGRPLWYCVRGNCDWGILGDGYATERVLDFEGHRLLLTHGHLYRAKESEAYLLSRAAQIGADIVLYGHTHQATHRVISASTCVDGNPLPRAVHLFNPGSIGGYAHSFGTLLLRGKDVLFSHGSV